MTKQKETTRWVAVLLVGVVAVGAGFLIPILVPGYLGSGKGGPGPNPFLSQAPAILLIAGLAGVVVGLSGIARSRPAWRRLSVLSASCGALALLLGTPSPWIRWDPWVGIGYYGIWLAGLVGLVAIGAAFGTFIRPMRNKALDASLAVLGLLAGMASALWALWVLGLTIGGVGD